MKHKGLTYISIVIIILGISISSCKKESFITSQEASLYTSLDSVKFDTVFTTIGSVTQSFKIYNNNDQALRLSTIKLMGGNSSPFKININGVPATEVQNFEIAANDSIYVFVSVTINPTSNQLAFIVSDSILINYNGNNKFVQLQAYGQNAHFYKNKIIAHDTTWTNDLPFVLLGSLQIQEGQTLTIQDSCRVFLHATAPILVEGSLLVKGQKGREVVFAGDRMDYYYKDLPGSWPGIYFKKTSKNNDLRFAVIKNADYAISIDDSTNLNDTILSVHQTIIDNALNGALAAKNSKVYMDNSLISNCGRGINIERGGYYEFTNCTIAAFSSKFISHTIPVVQLRDYAAADEQLSHPLNAQFNNCIIWGDGGSVDDEIFIDARVPSSFVYRFDSCVYKGVTPIANVSTNGLYYQYNAPQFINVDVSNNVYDFRINDPSSPAASHGKSIPAAMEYDLDNNRRGTSIDIGCYKIN